MQLTNICSATDSVTKLLTPNKTLYLKSYEYSTVMQFHVINFLILGDNCTTTIISVFSYKVFRVINNNKEKVMRA